MYRRVLIPLDGSLLAEGIVPFILDIAGPLDLDVVLLRVVPVIPPDVIEASRHIVLEDVEGRLAEARAYLEPIADTLRAKGIRVSVEVRRGEPVTEIAAAAGATGSDLIAMTTHGRSGLGRLLFGSVAEAVLRQAEIPVFLMRLTEAQAFTRAAGGAPR
ncbi:MAG: universal stress protein [Candidatus Rokubacteria bacterium]|nr:universal stress protein [Candidatus Rokubacteria bacterium]